MGQSPQNTQHEQLSFYFSSSMQSLDESQELELQQSFSWMVPTMIEDDDLMFGGKPLCTWYEEDRRRFSMGEECAPSPAYEIEEEERRGRQRDRPHYNKSSHKNHEKSSSAKTSESEGEEKKQ